MLQKEWGKCSEQWIISGGYCEITCGRCSCTNQTKKESDANDPPTSALKEAEEDRQTAEESSTPLSETETDNTPAPEDTTKLPTSSAEAAGQISRGVESGGDLNGPNAPQTESAVEEEKGGGQKNLYPIQVRKQCTIMSPST